MDFYRVFYVRSVIFRVEDPLFGSDDVCLARRLQMTRCRCPSAEIILTRFDYFILFPIRSSFGLNIFCVLRASPLSSLLKESNGKLMVKWRAWSIVSRKNSNLLLEAPEPHLRLQQCLPHSSYRHRPRQLRSPSPSILLLILQLHLLPLR